MNRRLVFLVVWALCVVGIGYYRSWFTVSKSSPNAESHKVNVNVTVDPDRVKADAKLVKDKAAELTGRATEGAHDFVDQASEAAP